MGASEMNDVIEKLPEVIRIEPSSLCNLRCIHCPTGQGKNKSLGIMNIKVFDRIFENIRSIPPRVVVLYHGGEPFLNEDIFKMIDKVKSLDNIFIKIDTNGMLLNEELMLKIIESKVDSLYISLDGLSPEENNNIRRGCDYNKVVGNVKRLMELKRKFKSPFPKIKIANVQIPRACTLGKEVPDMPKYIVNDFLEYKDEVEFQSVYSLKWFGLGRKDFGVVKDNKCKKSNYCDMVVNTITFRWNGDVVPCCYDITSEYVIANILDSTLKEIWNNKKYVELRRSIITGNNIPLCKDCRVLDKSSFIFYTKRCDEK